MKSRDQITGRPATVNIAFDVTWPRKSSSYIQYREVYVENGVRKTETEECLRTSGQVTNENE